MNEIALKRKLSEVVEEYETKKENIVTALQTYEQSCSDLKAAASIDGVWGQVNIDTGRVYERQLFEALLKSAWLRAHQMFNLKTLMTANDQKRFDQSMADPPEFTIENIRASFGNYIADPMGNILRGLAEVFCGLDQSYKSHEKVKIGVDGLPKRIIMSGFGSYTYWGWEKLADVVNALASYQGKPLVNYFELRNDLEKDPEHYRDSRGFSLKLFKNGNGHVIFTPDTLKDINRSLAAYYGEVLADCHEEKPGQRQQSTEVSKDLQYYPTPMDVVRRVLEECYLQEGKKVLEPSCGCGRIMDGLRQEKQNVKVLGCEVDPARAQEARDKGHKVITANFLTMLPPDSEDQKFDWVIMNPPFYGKHYAKHIEHALKFLKEDGVLVSILPATARYDHGLIEKMGYKNNWFDLPFGSFRESGTNINTSVVKIFK